LIIFNDYALLYYFKEENNYYARDFMLKKYTPYIKKNINYFIPYSNKKDDLFIECLLTLLKCIDFYDNSMDVSFFTYFAISLRRTINRELKRSYYKEFILEEESYFEDDTPSYNLYKGERLFEDKLLQNIYNECVIGNMSILEYSKYYNVSYYIVKKKYNDIISYLKLIFH
jgi:hypothetical protein